MDREEKINTIYKEIANKNTTIWCKARIYYTNHFSIFDEYFFKKTKYVEVILIGNCYLNDWQRVKYEEIEGHFLKDGCLRFENFDPIDLKDYKDLFLVIIWCPIMIWSVFKQIRFHRRYGLNEGPINESDFENIMSEYYNKIIQIRKDFEKPIDDQPEECIDYVYSLIKEVKWENTECLDE